MKTTTKWYRLCVRVCTRCTDCSTVKHGYGKAAHRQEVNRNICVSIVYLFIFTSLFKYLCQYLLLELTFLRCVFDFCVVLCC